MNDSDRSTNVEIWLHRVARLLACGMFVSIASGGLVTTYRAGMSIPDWPHTLGHTLFFYPPGDWLAVWDVFLAHGHRLMGIGVEVLSIGFALVLWRFERRRWLQGIGVLFCVVVMIEGLVGGLRVVENELLLAMIHACMAPLLFLLSRSIVAWTSPVWRRTSFDVTSRDRGLRFGLVLVVAIYVQIVLGAPIRHLIPGLHPFWFTLGVWSHFVVGSVVLVGVMIVWMQKPRKSRLSEGLSGRSLLMLLVSFQWFLGLGTWIVRYGFPAWFSDNLLTLGYTVVSGGRLQVLISTTHMVLGTLSLATAWSIVLWSGRVADGADGKVRSLSE